MASGVLSKSVDQVSAALEQATAALSATDIEQTVHVDESAHGSDTTGRGTKESPYATVLGAYIGSESPSVTVLVCKAPSGDDPSPEYQPATASSVKKAKKGYEQHVKKQARAEEVSKKQEEAEAAKSQAELQKLQDAKAIVLAEPEGAAKAKKIKLKHTKENRGQRVRMMGWVHRLRQQGGLTFLVLRDGTGYLQCVLSGNLVSLFSSLVKLLLLSYLIYRRNAMMPLH